MIYTQKCGHPSVGTVIVVGDYAKGVTGPYGKVTAGDYGIASVGHNGKAVAGRYGTAIAGDYGTAIAGDYGTAIVGCDGRALTGEGGMLSIEYRDGDGVPRVITGRAGLKGIKPNVAYLVLKGKLVRV
jgi:hypothetical protein